MAILPTSPRPGRPSISIGLSNLIFEASLMKVSFTLLTLQFQSHSVFKVLVVRRKFWWMRQSTLSATMRAQVPFHCVVTAFFTPSHKPNHLLLPSEDTFSTRLLNVRNDILSYFLQNVFRTFVIVCQDFDTVFGCSNNIETEFCVTGLLRFLRV